MKKLFIFLAGGAVALAVVFVFNQLRSSDTKTNIQTYSNDTVAQQTNNSVIADYSNKGLTQFPKEVLSKTDTTILYLQNNKLTGAMPAEIKNLNKLVIIDASYNQMTGVPAEVGQLKNVKTLNFANNQLTGLPLELGNLTQLEVLDLRGNNVSQQDLEQIKAKLTKTTIYQ